jgi:hypothetical protein
MDFKIYRFIPMALSLALFLGLLSLLSVAQAQNDALTLIGVGPSYGWNDVETYVHIYGNGDDFTEPLTVSLRNTPLTVTEVLSDRLLVIVPARMTPSLYDLTVETANGLSDTLEAAYRVLEPTDVDDLTSFREWLWSEPRTMRVGYTESALGLNVQRLGGRLFQNQHLNGVTVEFVLKLESRDVVLGRSQTPPIGPTFVESTGKVIWEPEEAGQYLICAIIDPDHEIDERDGEEPNRAEDNNQICRTVTVLEQVLDLVNPVVNYDFQLNDGASSTSAVTVTLDVTGEDPPPNPRSGLDALRFLEFEYILGAGWSPVQGSDWIPYSTAHQDYPWTLADTYGIRYMRVWSVDKAGNISLDSRVGRINLLPSEQVASVAKGQLDFYRIFVNAGETLSVTLTPEKGDPDLYIWGSGNNSPWSSNNPLGVESLTIPMTETGTYQIEVHGYTEAEYYLSFEVTEVQPLRASQAGSDNKPVPTGPRVPLEDIPADNLSLDPPQSPVSDPPPPVSNNIYLPIMTTR